MATRQRLIAGNWKMNGTLSEARALAEGLLRDIPSSASAGVLVCPPFTALPAVGEVLRGSHIALGGQNVYFQERGAFTGEISPGMLLDLGCTHVIVGHSERRRQMGETSELVNRKVKLALASGLVPIVCIGETLPEREAGETEKVIGEQLRQSLDGVDAGELTALVLAYEPVWAIGTGKVATPEQAAEVHRYVRTVLPDGVAGDVSILYGGSVSPDNAASLLALADVDGALVGGASLKSDSFAAIVAAA